MRAEKFIVTTSVGTKSKNQVWDSQSPLGIGFPFQWVLERSGTGVRVRQLTGNANQVKAGKFVVIPSDAIESGRTIEMPLDPGATAIDKSKFHLKVQRARLLKPAYMAPVDGASLAGTTQPQLLAFAGMRRTLMSCQPVHSAYVAYARQKPCFTIYHTADGFKVKPLLPGTQLKLKGLPPVNAAPGEAWHLKGEQLLTATVLRGRYWWRFSVIQQPGAIPTGIRGIISDEETAWFNKTLKRIGALVLLFLFITFLYPEAEKAVVEKPKPPVVTLHLPSQKIAKTNTSAGAESSQGAIKEAIHEASSKPLQKPRPKTPVVMSTAEAPKVKEPAARAVVKDNRAAKRAAQKAEFLKDVFTGAKALAEKGPIAGVIDGGPSKKTDLFNTSSSAVSGPGRVAPSYAPGTGKVAGLGGGAGAQGTNGNGVGYASGEHASLGSGHGGSFVGLDSNGSSVDEGLTKEEVGAVIHQHMSEVRYCHESAMLSSPKLEGKMLLNFTIGKLGDVLSVNLGNSTVQELALPECVMTRLKTWKFPHPRGGVKVSVSYPFLFKTLGHD